MRGHIKKRGENWSVVIELPRDTITGKRKQKWYTVKGNKKDAEKFLTKKLQELDTGLLINTKKIKYSEYLDYWLKESCIKNLKQTTIDGYKHNIERHIKPFIGNVFLEQLKPLHLQDLYSKKLENGKLNNEGGLSNKTVLTIHRIIHRSLEQAVKWELVVRNVADSVQPPKPKKYIAKFLNEKEINTLIEKSKSTNLYIPIIIAIYTGMRRGEILGLSWDNIDLKKGIIKVNRTLSSTTQGLQFSIPKTESSNRNIYIPNVLIKELKKHKIKQNQNKLKYGNLYIENNLVCTLENGNIINPKNFSRDFHKLLKNNNLTLIRFHDLRHTHASLLVKLGIQPKVISSRLGHSNINITMDLYSHVYTETDKSIANMFEKLLIS